MISDYAHEHLQRIVDALEKPNQHLYTGDVYLEVVDEPSLDYVSRIRYEDGKKSTSLVLTSMVGCKFYRNRPRGTFNYLGMRYIETQCLHMIHWQSPEEYRKDRYFKLIQEIVDNPRLMGVSTKWRLELTDRLPWYRNPTHEDGGTRPLLSGEVPPSSTGGME